MTTLDVSILSTAVKLAQDEAMVSVSEIKNEGLMVVRVRINHIMIWAWIRLHVFYD